MAVTDEEALQQVVTRGATAAFPGVGPQRMSQQVALPSGPCDIRAMAHDGRWWVIEVKRDGVTPTTIDRVLRYKRELDARHPGTTHHPMIAGLRCSSGTQAAAKAAGVSLHVFDKNVMQAPSKSSK